MCEDGETPGLTRTCTVMMHAPCYPHTHCVRHWYSCTVCRSKQWCGAHGVPESDGARAVELFKPRSFPLSTRPNIVRRCKERLQLKFQLSKAPSTLASRRNLKHGLTRRARSYSGSEFADSKTRFTQSVVLYVRCVYPMRARVF